MSTTPVSWKTPSGWTAFAAILLLTVGIMNVLDGLVALFNKEYFGLGNGDVLVVSFTAWGWFWLILGVVQLLVSFGLFGARSWARVTAIVLVCINAILAVAYLPGFPIWSLVVIMIDLLVIYGLVVRWTDEPLA